MPYANSWYMNVQILKDARRFKKIRGHLQKSVFSVLLLMSRRG